MNTRISSKRWQTFILERFPPLRHLLLISCLFGANAFATVHSTASSRGIPFLGFVVVLLAFFRLRLFDEIKDYETDKQINPYRPLARGLIPLKEAKKTAFSLLALELLLSRIIGPAALIATSCYAAYSLLMYKEFFVGSWLRPKLAIYALTHTVVSGLISLFIFSSITGLYFWNAPTKFLLFPVANWMIFNVFEFGRKTFGEKEEREGVDSYSKNFGSWGAFFIVLAMAIVAVGLALLFRIPFSIPMFAILSLYLLITGMAYGHLNTTKSAIAFRKACSAFILIYNLIICLGFILCSL